jgi:hypothetical protein
MQIALKREQFRKFPSEREVHHVLTNKFLLLLLPRPDFAFPFVLAFSGRPLRPGGHPHADFIFIATGSPTISLSRLLHLGRKFRAIPGNRRSLRALDTAARPVSFAPFCPFLALLAPPFRLKNPTFFPFKH